MCCFHYVFRRVFIGLLLLGVAAPALGQSGRMSGQVVDENGDPIAGAQIRAEKPDANPVTDSNLNPPNSSENFS